MGSRAYPVAVKQNSVDLATQLLSFLLLVVRNQFHGTDFISRWLLLMEGDSNDTAF